MHFLVGKSAEITLYFTIFVRSNAMRFKGISSEVYVYAVPTQGIPEIVKQNQDGSFTVLIDESLNRLLYDTS